MSLTFHSHGLKLVFVAVSVSLLGLGSFLLMAVPEASAGDAVKLVRGYVKDSVGRLLEGASVVVEIWDPTNTTLRASRSDSTDSAGFYAVDFGVTDWEVGDWIKVTSDYEGKQGVNGTVAKTVTAPFIQWVYVIYPYEIPEFGSPLGLMVAGLAMGVVAIAVIVYFRRK